MKPSFPTDLIRTLAVEEFMSLSSADARQTWARAHGVDRLISLNLIVAVRKAYINRKNNERLGLPDPLRSH